MDFKKGTVVKSAAGRDRDQWFIVWEVDGDTVLLVDGKIRPLEKPKRKKKKHCHPTHKMVSLSKELIGNKAIYRKLQETVSGNDSEL